MPDYTNWVKRLHKNDENRILQMKLPAASGRGIKAD